MDLRPILSTLQRHKTAAALIVLEIALSCAIICNALFLIGNRIERMQRVSGLAENELVRVRVEGIAKDQDSAAVTRADLAALAAIPGVTSVASTNQVTYGNSAWNSSITLVKDQKQPNMNVATYIGSQQLFDTMGLHLLAGRQFLPDEFIEWDAIQAPESKGHIASVIITRTMAEKLYPGVNAIGKTFFAWGEEPHRVVGVVDHLVRPNEQGGPAQNEYALLFPVNVSYDVGGNYLLRVSDRSRRDEVMKAALKTLETSGPTRIIPAQQAKTFEQMRAEYYRPDRAMIWLLVAVSIALLVVTALGIVGLASFWVQQRTRQIGVRRALGATRRQILHYFQAENFLLATAGIALGMLLAYAINQLLMSKYALPRLPLSYLPVGAVTLWLLGQIAVFGPARRAAAVPPAVATRSV
ncbi:MAG: ABC transporter permease [Luteimonas sp.]